MRIDNGSDNDYSLLPDEPPYKAGDRVRLVAVDSDDEFDACPEEDGVVLDVELLEGLVNVQLDDGLFDPDHDDGVRAVPFDQIKEIL
jgi:hypothetical protein